MKSGGKKRPPTRSNPIAGAGPKPRDSSTNAFERQAPNKRKGHIPEDLADAAEAALDDLVSRASPVPSSLLGRKTPVPPPLMPPDEDDDELDEPATTSRADSSVVELLQGADEDDDELDLASTGSGRRYQGAAPIGKGRMSQVQPPGMTEQVPTIALADLPGERSEPTRDERPSSRARQQPAATFDEVTSRKNPLPTTAARPNASAPFEEVTSRKNPLPTTSNRPNASAAPPAGATGRGNAASSPPANAPGRGNAPSSPPVTAAGRASPLPANVVARSSPSDGAGRASPVPSSATPSGRASPLPANVIARAPANTPTGPTGRASPVPASIVPSRPVDTATTPTGPTGRASPVPSSIVPGRVDTATPTFPTASSPGRASTATPTTPTSRTTFETPTRPANPAPTSAPLARIQLEKAKPRGVETPTRPSAAPPGRTNIATPTTPTPSGANAESWDRDTGDADKRGWDADTDDADSVGAALAYDGPRRSLTSVLEEERAELPPLRFAIYEDSAHLASAQGAIVAAGHVVALGASGRDGMTRVLGAVRSSAQALDAIIVSLPSGEPIIEAALALGAGRPIVIASVTGHSVDGVQRAIAAGADLVATRPHDVERLAPLLLAVARLDTERRANVQLRARLDELADPEPRGLQTLDIFERTIDAEIKRAKRFDYPLSVLLFAVEIPPPAPPPGILGILRARAGNALINCIRDIDSATQLDHERFIVLLPHTELKAAAGLARRIITAVAAGGPVVSAGRTFLPRVVGAAVAQKPGEPLTYTKLIKDATQAIESARRDGVELAVSP